jgi:large subunit ribosomal protein L6
MSRVGRKKIAIPHDLLNGGGSVILVESKRGEQTLIVHGPNGKLSKLLPPSISCSLEQSCICLYDHRKTKISPALHGLSRTHIHNMIIGVTTGFSKKLNISGVGYRVSLDSKGLVFKVGRSHLTVAKPPKEISIKLEGQNTITVSGIRKEVVAEFASKIRSICPPEPYKGKGIAYENEVIRRKVGKRKK